MNTSIGKVIFLGNSGVGKSTILSRLNNETIDGDLPSTIGIDFQKISTYYKDNHYTFNIWDTAGQERYSKVIIPYYRNIDIAIIMFSINDISSFNNITFWMNELMQYSFGCKIIIIGNKVDLNQERVISMDKINQFIQKNKLVYIESSMNNLNSIKSIKHKICEVFNKEIQERNNLSTPPSLRESLNISSYDTSNNKTCC